MQVKGKGESRGSIGVGVVQVKGKGESRGI